MDHRSYPHSAALSPTSTWQQRWALLLARLTLVSTEAKQEAELFAALTRPTRQTQRPITLAFINARAMNCAAHDLAFTRSLLAVDR